MLYAAGFLLSRPRTIIGTTLPPRVSFRQMGARSAESGAKAVSALLKGERRNFQAHGSAQPIAKGVETSRTDFSILLFLRVSEHAQKGEGGGG